MDKKLLHHLWTLIRPIKVWYLLVLLMVCASATVLAMRQNNLGMIGLREKVYQADQSGGDIEGALRSLRTYVYGHMNTKLASGDSPVYPPIQLKYTYQRLKQAENERVKQVNAQVYTDAQNYCERLFPGSFSGGPRVPCIESYVSEHGVKERDVPDALYKFDFASPSWSPDLAGFSLLLTIVVIVLTSLRILIGAALKRLTR